MSMCVLFTTACFSSDEDANLYETLDDLPENEPSTLDEITDYPSGPLANTSYKDEMESMIDIVKKRLPSIDEDDDTDESYLHDWWRVYHSIFAEEYPEADHIYEEMDIEPFHHPALAEEEIFYKDKINVLIVLDLSGSMKKELDGESMISIARKAVLDFISGLPDGANVGLRVYGHVGSGKDTDKAYSCSSSELIYDVQPYDKKEFKGALNKYEPTGWTPIAYSLEQTKMDFKDYPADEYTNLVYVVSDGIETCDGNPVEVAESLSDSEIHPIDNVIGYGVDKKAQKQLEEIAEVGKGIYAEAGAEDELTNVFDEQKDLFKQWDEWKKVTSSNIKQHREDQEQGLEDFLSDWRNVNNRERENLFFVINELRNDGFITEKAHSYFATMRNERTESYEQLAKEAYYDLKGKIINNFEENQRIVEEKLELND